jgi:flagellar basal-body rod modification protein FlgD
MPMTTIDPRSLAASSGLLETTGLGGAAGSVDRIVPPGASDIFGLTRDDFFRLFLAQLRNQDPTHPLDDKDFLAQLAQFTLIDAIQQMREAFDGSALAGASSLLGKVVEGHTADGTRVQGTVDRVVQDATGIHLVVGGQSLRPQDVDAVVSATSQGSAGLSSS